MSYSIIYADPPWFRGQRMYSANKNDHHVEASRHYPVMKVEDICALNIKDIAADDCALFMWTTNAHLPHALDIIETWGFTYRTIAFNWVKKYPNGNLRVLPGPWTNGGSEICLMGGKGNMKQFKQDPRVKQCLIQEVSKHSKKPQEIADRIVKLFPDVNRIELFARDAKEGWDIWGNEINNTIEL